MPFYILLAFHLGFYLLLIVLTLFVLGMRNQTHSEVKTSSRVIKIQAADSDPNREGKTNKDDTLERVLGIGLFIGQTVMMVPTCQLVARVFNCQQLE